ncbi:alpha/beta fold hydrolase [Pseudomonas baltica]|uniref:alpha/beta fold hydrolase n=1 Tax=Pseudomonas baltica TaxID=2762576 RepID=UPI00289C91EA|nr:alpha/beta fold hydrolase [Pseudomonas baltica]
MTSHAYYNQQNHGPYELVDVGALPLISGETLHQCRLAVATFGQLNAARNNAILIPTWYSGTSRIIADVFIGAGRAIDPGTYFIIIVNQIGNGLSSSPHNTQGPQARGHFPKIAIADDVSAQYRLVTEHFGVQQLALVMGGSMGAQQAYEWAARYPSMVQRLATIAGTARTSPINQVISDAIIHGLRADPQFKGGEYADSTNVSEGLKQHARLMTLHGLSPEFFESGHYTSLRFASVGEFVEGFMTPYFETMDPNALITQLEKWRGADVSHITGGDLRAALGRITARTCVLPITQDQFFPPSVCEAEARLISDATCKSIDSPFGHLALFGADANWLRLLDMELKALLR